MEYISTQGSDYILAPETALRILRTQSVGIIIPVVVFLFGGLVFWQRKYTAQQLPKQHEREETPSNPGTTDLRRNEVLKLSMMAKALRDCEEDVVRTMLQEINMLSDSAIEDAIELLFTDIIPDTDFESFPDFMGNIT
ncbi:uncharacterized protein EURHEDRAFT_381573 [Aspergillus ruber CBS 135680]|uniref:Uncharacterized protein n=1 Tax=Aspergillus ruber (strain CBS 135680) TaxID=1388766 RepID=A0A017S2F8_ASPRC|nr:uncharacterized protein EURHEDRAFT_381573 [Aspergillus ruber CBS 135680]EYE90829.1 hypothetical protein EURHEDRAFT_381573 [Aspergillus ruber CBS 135680]